MTTNGTFGTLALANTIVSASISMMCLILAYYDWGASPRTLQYLSVTALLMLQLTWMAITSKRRWMKRRIERPVRQIRKYLPFDDLVRHIVQDRRIDLENPFVKWLMKQQQ